MHTTNDKLRHQIETVAKGLVSFSVTQVIVLSMLFIFPAPDGAGPVYWMVFRVGVLLTFPTSTAVAAMWLRSIARRMGGSDVASVGVAAASG